MQTGRRKAVAWLAQNISQSLQCSRDGLLRSESVQQVNNLVAKCASRNYGHLIANQGALPHGQSRISLGELLQRSGISRQKAFQPYQHRSGGGGSGPAVWGCRRNSTVPSPKAAQQKLSEIVTQGSNAAKGGASALYNRLPAQARKLLSDAGQPGQVQKVLKLQLEAFWGRHNRKLLVLGGAVTVYLLWRSLFGFASMFFKLSETMADFGFLALAAALASFGFLYVRRLYTIHPDSIYRLAMLQLNTNPGILEVMGAPVAGSNVRASVLTGGGLRMKGLQPRLRSRRVQMIFPLTGSERRGLVSLEAKKLKGKYLFKLLAVDVPTRGGQEQRLFVEGDEKVYAKGGILSELRDPFLQAISMKEADELEDEIDDAAADAEADHQKRIKKAAKVGKEPKPLDGGGGMYFYERAYWALRRALAAPHKPVAAETLPVPGKPSSVVPKTNPISPVPVPEKTSNAVQPATDPVSPQQQPEEQKPVSAELDEVSKVHQYKKESSSQQAP